MRIDVDCLRDVLSYLIEQLRAKVDTSDGSSEFISTYLQIIYRAEALAKYNKEDIFYCVYNLYKCGYIECIVNEGDRKRWISCEIYNITYEGQQFYESIRGETTWEKTKSIISKIGNHALYFIEETAQMVAVESAKTVVTIMMSGNTNQ